MNKPQSLLLIFALLSVLMMHGQLIAEPVNNKQPTEEKLSNDEIRQHHFKNIDELVVLQAPGLALSYVQREQPEYVADNPLQWLFWEQKHISLLAYTKQWQALVDRVNAQREKLLSPKVATADRNWFFTEQVKALIQQKQYAVALNTLRQLIWNASVLVKSQTLAAWRRLVIQVYLNQNQLQDARLAMHRYQQDYGSLQNEDGVYWLNIQAELLIQLAQYREAIALLETADTQQAQALKLLARYKAEYLSAQDALDEAQLLQKKYKDSESIQLFEYVALVAATGAHDTAQAITQLESLLSVVQLELSDSLINIGGITVDADRLWSAYSHQGNQLANAKGLLKGDDNAWYALSNNYLKSDALNARALLAVLSLQARQQAQRYLAMQQLAKLLQDKQKNLQLVERLFAESNTFLQLSAVAPEVRYQLIDFNLAQGRVKQAAVLFAGLQQPPADQQQIDWNLRRARVLILSGDFQSGADALAEILQNTSLDGHQVDKFLQVIFDLQAVEQHRLSIRLFTELSRQVSDSRVLRELKFWMAESYHSLKDYEKAAYLFLKSAIPPEKIYDPWYHTATYRAAESLLDAGLYDDARQRFLHLLSITQNAARKAVIRQRLQSIRLNRQISNRQVSE